MYDNEVFEAMLDRIEHLAADKARLRSELNTAEEALDVKVEVSKMLSMPDVKALMVVCLSDPQNKIGQIKAVRQLTGANLKDAKDAVMDAWFKAGKSWDGVSVVEWDDAPNSPYDGG